MLSIAHVLNVIEIKEPEHPSYLHVAQPLTMRSMVAAKKHAEKEGVSVDLVAIKHHSEQVRIPDEFKYASDIDRYAYEFIEALKEQEPRKPLPRLVDIINGVFEASDANYLIYTNVDIGLYPNFYTDVQKLIASGYDSICINRRTLPKRHRGILLDETTLDKIVKLKGRRHPGIDCFVFRRDIVPNLELGNVFLGFPPVDQVLKTQIEKHSKNFVWIKDRVLTFHIGLDRSWKGESSYRSENHSQAFGLYKKCFSGKSGLLYNLKNRIISLRD